MRPEHKPFRDPCVLCGFPALEHRLAHPHEPSPGAPDACARCGLPPVCHRAATAEERADAKAAGARKKKRSGEIRPRAARPRAPAPTVSGPFVGVDGEGLGRRPHRYVYLAAASDEGHSWELADPGWAPAWEPDAEKRAARVLATGSAYAMAGVRGLSTEACLGFLLGLPREAKLFGFALGYDLTKWLEDLDDETLWLLFRPEERPRKGKGATRGGPRPVTWRGWELNLQGTHFSLARGGERRDVWDVWKFYGCRFTQALQDWKVGTEADWEEVDAMKSKRGAFDQESPEDVQRYCRDNECPRLAAMARKLALAHEAVGLPLKVFHGPGSSAGAMLTKMGIKAAVRAPCPEMQGAVARAFFGGRFENAVVGAVDRPALGLDISSAYPYQLWQLPCLVHGSWRHVTRRGALDGAEAALVHYGFRGGRPAPGSPIDAGTWGPFPYRFGKGQRRPNPDPTKVGIPEEGSICFPRESPGGWVYLAEYLAGERAFPEVRFREAWVYERACTCRPFAEIPHYYLYRIQLGKEGPGITIKLAVNSCYGKLAQSVGHAVFGCWLWAGMITSGCRAQALDVLALHRDPTDMLMVATDGIATLQLDLEPPAPIDTGTRVLLPGSPADAADPVTGENKKPLGGWERQELPDGLLLARPGVYFPLHLGLTGGNAAAAQANKKEVDKLVKKIKARGVGKAVLLRHYEDILLSWVRHRGAEPMTATKVARFCGAKTSVHRSGPEGERRYGRADGTSKSEHGAPPSYGQWVERPVVMSWDPLPKRARIEGRVPGVDYQRLSLRSVALSEPESAPYDPAVISQEAAELRAFADEVGEQPDPGAIEDLMGEFGEEMGL